ncbi:MAG: Gfo/Idh/MocA family oxidoreductase [Planctomycetia bacterium]|nr:Gfo/Idh/MocA family oxidoreductase [Planctomycetia bacterium]
MKSISRRHFMKTGAAVALASTVVARPGLAQSAAPSSKLNIAVIGPANRGAASLAEMLKENVVALCDVDARYLEAAKGKAPSAQLFSDFRQMFEKVKDIDGVCVCTPDHTHAAPSVMAMRAGIHCYCEKPLAHDVRECRVMQQIAEEKKLVTQMGTQIHAGENYRRVVELVQSGVVGPIEEVHVWCGKGWGLPPNATRPTDTPPVPDYLNWDAWIGPAQMRPYHPRYVPAHWRRWWAFGNGTIGDMACHYMDLPFWALELRDCLTAEAIDGPPVNLEGCPLNLTVKYTFPAREKFPACTLYWYDGDKRPAALKQYGVPERGAGVLFVGKEGVMFADYGSHALYPQEKFRDFKRPDKSIPASIGHHNEWLQAIRDNRPEDCTCKFGYSGRLTETVLLGTVAYRTGKELRWDADAMKVTNVPEANDLIAIEYRDGWIL